MQYGLKLQWSENTLDDFHDIMFTLKYITHSQATYSCKVFVM